MISGLAFAHTARIVERYELSEPVKVVLSTLYICATSCVTSSGGSTPFPAQTISPYSLRSRKSINPCALASLKARYMDGLMAKKHQTAASVEGARRNSVGIRASSLSFEGF